MTEEDPMFEFLRKRGVQENVIEQMKHEKVQSCGIIVNIFSSCINLDPKLT